MWEGSPGTFSGATTGVGWSGKQDTNLCDAITASCEPHSDSQQFVECWWEILDSLPLPVVISRTPTRHWQGPCLSWKVKASGVVEKQDTNMCDVITASCEPWLWVLIPNRKISRQACSSHHQIVIWIGFWFWDEYLSNWTKISTNSETVESKIPVRRYNGFHLSGLILTRNLQDKSRIMFPVFMKYSSKLLMLVLSYTPHPSSLLRRILCMAGQIK